MHLSKKQVDDYQKFGVIVVKDKFKDWIEPLREGFKKVLEKPSKHGRETPDYLHPLLEDILRPTYGVIIYQEQVMQIAQKLSGFTAGQADLLRRAMGKKKKK